MTRHINAVDMRLLIRQDADSVADWVAAYIKSRILKFDPTPDRPFVLGASVRPALRAGRVALSWRRPRCDVVPQCDVVSRVFWHCATGQGFRPVALLSRPTRCGMQQRVS